MYCRIKIGKTSCNLVHKGTKKWHPISSFTAIAISNSANANATRRMIGYYPSCCYGSSRRWDATATIYCCKWLPPVQHAPRQSMHAIRYQSTVRLDENRILKNATPMSHLTLTHNEQERNNKMQQLALSIQLLRDPKRYKEFRISNQSNANHRLLSDAKMVVEYYANAKAVFPLNKPKDESCQFKNPLTTLSGPELCHSLISDVILPHYAQGERVTAKQLECILHMCFLTVQSLGKLCIKYNRQKRGWNKGGNETEVIHLGDLAEQLLRQLLNTPFVIVVDPPGTGTATATATNNSANQAKGRKAMAKATHLYNNTLNTWSCIASTTMNATLAKDAALRAERLLLDLATSRNRGNIQSTKDVDTRILPNDREGGMTTVLLDYVKPNAVSFNTTINAWSRSGRFGKNLHGRKVDLTTVSAAERAEAILHLLEDLYDESTEFGSDANDGAIMPDILSYEAVIYAWSRALDFPQAPIRATKILEDIMERYYKAHANKDVGNTRHWSNHRWPPFPSRQTFSSVLTTWARSSLTDSGKVCSEAMEEAEKLFSQMKQLGRDGYEQNNPDTISYNALLQVYANQIENVLNRNNISSAVIGEATGFFQKMVNVVYEMNAANSTNKDVKMTQVDFCPDSTTYKLLLQSVIRIGSRIVRVKKNQSCDTMSVEECSQFALSYLQQLHGFLAQEILYDRSIKDLLTLFVATKNLEGIKTALNLLSTSQLSLKTCTKITGQYLEELIGIICSGTEQNCLPVPELVSAMETYLIDEVQKNSGIQPTTRMWNSVIEAYSKLASSHIKYAQDADRVMMHVLHRYKEAFETISSKNGVNKHFQVARPTTFTFHSVIAAYAEASNKNKLPNKSRMKAIERMEEVLSAMEDMNGQKQRIRTKYTAHVIPNAKTYNLLLNAYDSSIKQAKDMEYANNTFGKAEKLVQNMSDNAKTRRNTAAKPDNYTYATLLSILAKTKLSDAPDKARDILNEALEAGLDNFDTIIVNNAMNVLSSRDKCSKDVIEMFQQLENESLKNKSGKIRPDKFTYSIVMSSLANQGTIDAAKSVETLYNRMLDNFKMEKEKREARKIQPDIYCYNAIIKAWSNIHTTESLLRAENHLDCLLTSASTVEPDGSSFSVVIHGHSKRPEANAAADCERVLDKKEEYQKQNRKIPINIDDYRTTALKYKKELNPHGCLRILERLLRIMKEGNHSSRFLNTHQLTSVFNIVMESYFESSTENASTKIQEIFDVMEVEGLARPDMISYSILMNSYANNQSSDSLKTVDEILENYLSGKNQYKNIRPEKNAVLFDILFQACEISPPSTTLNPVTIAFDKFHRMASSDSKVNPTHKTYKHMLAICKNHIQNDSKRYELLQLLFQKCCADGQLSEGALSVFRNAMPKHQFEEAVSVILGRQMNAGDGIQITDFPRSCKLNVFVPRGRVSSLSSGKGDGTSNIGPDVRIY